MTAPLTPVWNSGLKPPSHWITSTTTVRQRVVEFSKQAVLQGSGCQMGKYYQGSMPQHLQQVWVVQCSRCSNWSTGQISVQISRQQNYNKRYAASWQMITCLLKSCSAECLNKVRNSSDNHVVTSNSGETSKDGLLFLCILISRVVINNRSTLSYYSHQLTCLISWWLR